MWENHFPLGILHEFWLINKEWKDMYNYIDEIRLEKKRAQSYLLTFFQTFGDFGIRNSQGWSYFSHCPCQISPLNSFPFGRY